MYQLYKKMKRISVSTQTICQP